MEELGVAFALVLIIEGLCYALFPEAMRKTMAEILKLPADKLRTVGVSALCIGALIVWLIKG